MKRVIFTADDFGASTLVNEAIELAHRGGVLSTASLMVAGPAADDAIQRAKRLPNLHVGLHLVCVDGTPLLPPDAIPTIVDSDGKFLRNLVRAGMLFYFSRQARHELAMEIRAQFRAFAATGLRLDHANAHNHMHTHPTVLETMIRVGQEFGVKAMRVPREPFGPSWHTSHRKLWDHVANAYLLWPLLRRMQIRLRRAGITTNDFVFGLNDTGRMTPATVRSLVHELPDGVSEMYFHPATRRWVGMPADALCEEELAALTDETLPAALTMARVTPTTFGALVSDAAA